MPTRRYHVMFALLVPAFFCLASAARATTRTVPGDAPTIQAGIDLSAVGDTVLVSPGTYTGPGNRDIDFHGKDIVVRSSAGPTATIVDCQGGPTPQTEHRGFQFHNGESRAARLDGFTIKNGTSEFDIPENGGGISCFGGSPTIANCIITHNYAGGGGFPDAKLASPWTSDKTAKIAMGGGIACLASHARIENCEITDNTTNGGTGGIVILGGAVELVGCLIAGNGPDGIGVYGESTRLENCTISGNLGSGVLCGRTTSIILERTIVWGNCVGTTHTDINLVENTSSATAICSLVDSVGLRGVNQVEFVGPNFFSDPLFGNPASCSLAPNPGGSYRLQPQSAGLPENNACGVLIGALGSTVATSVPAGPSSPGAFVLSIYPNPSHATTQFRFVLGEESSARLTLFDPAGRRVRTFDVRGSAGSVAWDGRDTNGMDVPSGTYFLRLDAPNRHEIRRFTRLR